MLMGIAGYDEDLGFLQMRLNTLTQALRNAQARGLDAAVIEDLKTRYREISGRLAKLRIEVSNQEMPSQFMQTLANIGANLEQIGSTIAKASGEVLVGVGSTVKMLPLLLVGALVVLGIGLSKGSISVRR